MDKSLVAESQVNTQKSQEELWDALTNPDKIAKYLFGTETITTWEEGSDIVFQGVYEGHKYKDKGKVVNFKINQRLTYLYWSQFSGIEDKIENYGEVDVTIVANKNERTLNWKQTGFSSPKNCEHTQAGLEKMLEQICDLA